jgi:hypothetical protein
MYFTHFFGTERSGTTRKELCMSAASLGIKCRDPWTQTEGRVSAGALPGWQETYESLDPKPVQAPVTTPLLQTVIKDLFDRLGKDKVLAMSGQEMLDYWYENC